MVNINIGTPPKCPKCEHDVVPTQVEEDSAAEGHRLSQITWACLKCDFSK